MKWTTFLSILVFYLAKYFPEELDTSLKPIDSAGCIPCRDIVFDFIIVGAGSAGCVVANRLSENSDWKVLLIEAGGDEDFVTDIPLIPTSHYLGTRYDWNYSTVIQENYCQGDGGVCNYKRGRGMGGSSTINDLILVRGNQEDFNEWERMGNPGWSYQDVFPYFLKLENMTIPELASSPYHSTGGPLSVAYGRYNNTIFQDIYEAAQDYGLPGTDYNGASQHGVAYIQSALKGPTKCSTSKAYLDPIRDRTNLFIFKNTLVTKILFSDEDITKAVGVSCITDGQKYNVYSSKEVILSAGVIDTPKLLILSGIGPREHLEELDIPVRVDLPVGETFFDHSSCLTPAYAINKTTGLNITKEVVEDAIIDYAKNRRGILTSTTLKLIAFLNSTMGALDVQLNLRIDITDLGETVLPTIGFTVINVRPKSVGSLRLKSADYKDAPLIDPNYLGVKSDMEPLKWGIKQGMEIIESSALSKYCPKMLNDTSTDCNISEPLTDVDLECLIRYSIVNTVHGCGTAKMGPRCDKTAVVDPTLRVHGVCNLRVVDASVFPRITTGNPLLPTVMVGEKGSDLIKQSYQVS